MCLGEKNMSQGQKDAFLSGKWNDYSSNSKFVICEMKLATFFDFQK